MNALEALEREESFAGITTGSSSIDSIFGNGIPLGAVTEICGMAGLGKVLSASH
jgi:RecA/RadA recombinase